MIVVTLINSSSKHLLSNNQIANNIRTAINNQRLGQSAIKQDLVRRKIRSNSKNRKISKRNSNNIRRSITLQQNKARSVYGFSQAQASFATQQANFNNSSSINNLQSSISSALRTANNQNSQVLTRIKDWIQTATGTLEDITAFERSTEGSNNRGFGQFTTEDFLESNQNLISSFANESRSNTDDLMTRLRDMQNEHDEHVSASFSEQLRNMLSSSLQTTSDILTTPTRVLESGNEAIDGLIAFAQSRAIDLIRIMGRVENGDFNSVEELNSELFSDELGQSIGEILFFFMSIMPLLQRLISTQYAGVYQGLDWIVNKDVAPSMLNWNEYISAFNRGALTDSYVIDKLKKLGYSDELIQHLFVLGTDYPSQGDIAEMYRRGIVDRDRFENLLEAIGINRGFNEEMEEIAWYQPPVQDVIRFAVRDVFNPEVVRDAGLFDNMPQEFVDLAEKSGLKPDMARLYWGAHWFLPSIQQGFEMLHRDVITDEQLDNLMQAADIAPNWRPRLKDIAYNVPTRVDTRRMFEDGVIDETTLARYLKAFGYNPVDAENIKQWYIRRKEAVENRGQFEARKLTLGLIGRAYMRGLIPRQLAVTKLTELDYILNDVGIILADWDAQIEDANEIDYTKEIKRRYKTLAEKYYTRGSIDENEAIELFTDAGLGLDESEGFIVVLDLEKELSRKDAIVTELKKLYIGYEITEVELYSILPSYGFNTTEISTLVTELSPFRLFRKRDLTRADVKKALAMGVISREEATNQYRGMGYSDRDISIILAIETSGDVT